MTYPVRPLVSIIIPTKNSSRTLPLTLASIARQSYRNIEVIVVDNYSRDSTVDIAVKFGAKVYRYGLERSAQKNFGAKKASGDILYFVDSDFYLHPKTVEEGVDLIRDGCDAVVVLNISNPRPSLVAKIRYYERLSYYRSGIYEAARLLRKDLFLNVGGFDESLYAQEDLELHQRIVKSGARVCWAEKSFEIHLGEPKSFAEFIKKSMYYGVGIKRYLSRSATPAYIYPIRPTFLKRWWVAYTARRWFPGLAMVPLLKAVQATAAALGSIFGGENVYD